MAHTEPFDIGDRMREVVKERGLDSVDELVRNIDPFGDGLDRIAQPVNDAYDYTHRIDGEAFPVFRYIKGMPLATDASGSRRPEGIVERDRLVRHYIDAIVDKEDFEGAGDFERGGDRLFIGVPSVHTVGLYGMDPWRSKMPPAPDPQGDRNAAEMLDVYAMEQLRDVPFVEWPNEPGGTGTGGIPQATLDAIEADIDDVEREFGDWWYDADRLFVEADTDGRDWGPYLSQFLVQDLQLWALNAEQTYLRYPETDHNAARTEWLDTIEGMGPYAAETNPKKPDREDQGYIATPRHLATVVNAEPPFQEYLIAAIQLLDGDFADNLPFTSREDARVFAYNETGPVGLLDMLTRAARQALLAAFYHKWRVHFRCRPETYSGRVHEQRDGTHGFGISTLLTNADILDERGPDTDYLTSAYVEGSPVHPAYPSGHSVIAGACGTVLKTWFPDMDTLPFDDTYVPKPDGQGREKVGMPDGHTGLYQEIDKLMSNIGLARMYAGVHYYSDHYRGVKLGEQVAVGMMTDIFRREYDADEEIRPTFKPYLEYGDAAELDVSLETLNALRREAAAHDADALWVHA
jgi:hypothetical protein